MKNAQPMYSLPVRHTGGKCLTGAYVRRCTRAVIVLVTFACVCFGEDKFAPEKYLVSTIPHELVKNAAGVVRHEVKTFEVINSRSAVESVHRLVTILNPKGRDFARASA